MQNKQQCHPCERSENVSIDATVWCSNCGEALCQKCCDLHRRFRTTTTHKTFPITTTTNEDFTFLAETNEFCSKHETKPLDVYCIDHSVLCCVVCLTVNHRTCEVKYIEELGDVKAENIELFLIELDDVKCSLNELIKSKARNKESLKSSFQTIEKEAISTTANLKKRMDDLCKTFIKNSGLMQDDLLTELDNVIKQAQGHTLVLDDWISRLRTVNSFGSRSQTLVAKENIKAELANKESNIKSLLNENQDIDVSTGFTENSEALSKVEMLGKISVLKHINKISDKRNNLFKSISVQLETLSLKFRSILGIKEKEFMSGLYILSDEVLQTPDMHNLSEFMQTFTSGAVDDLAVDKESSRLAVTKQKSKSVSFTSFQERKFRNTVTCTQKPVALAFGPDGILFVADVNCCISVISKNEQNLIPLIEKLEKLKNVRDIWTDIDSNALFVCGQDYVEIYDIQW
ncbi:uncharacterized protein LOC143077042 [Mytilus galloprovincialis]|uniref:uncharacterized protein LOC143077042 n=1 Tax=Mytilus galloprovincialis TaxID=29158 RepID=UPI003F7C5D14